MENMKLLPEAELIKILSEFYGKDFDDSSPEKKQEYINGYRKVEKDNNEQIQKHGSIEKWYLSGEGRLMDFNTK